MKSVLPLILLTVMMPACTDRLEPPPEHGVRADGTLDFVQGDSTVIHSITIEIADTEVARQRGLMNRRGMDLDEGMLFIFQAPDSLSFWMRNTAMPLDIIFVGENLSIVNIARRTRPLSDDFIRAAAPAQYVVEVRGGVTERYGITEHASIRWRRNNS